MAPTSGRDDGKRKRRASFDAEDGAVDNGTEHGAAGSAEALSRPSEEQNWSQKKQKKWARLLLRELYDLGYRDAAASLEREAAVQLCSFAMERFQEHVRGQEWDLALQLVVPGDGSDKLRMRSAQATREAALLLLQRKYIDLLLRKEVSAALRTFQEEILPVYAPSEEEVKQLAELLLCKVAEEMAERAQMPWKDEDLRARIECLVSPDEIIPEGVLRVSVCLSAVVMRLRCCCTEILLKHTDDVWELAFSPDGKLLASASRDGSIVLWQLDFDAESLSYGQPPQVSIKARRLPSSVDDLALHHEVLSTFAWIVVCLHGCVSLSSSLCCSLRGFIYQNAAEGTIAYQWGGRRVLDIVVDTHDSEMFVLISSDEIRVYDMAHKSDELFLKTAHPISCLSISSSGKYLLVNLLQQSEILCVEIATGSTVAKYRRLREQRYVLRPCFGGAHDELVVSGSEGNDSVAFADQQQPPKPAQQSSSSDTTARGGEVAMQRNELDAVLTSVGLGTPEIWQKLGQELDGKTQLEKPRVSKKVLVKALRMQTDAMRYMVDEFDRLRAKMADMELESRNTAKHVERVNSRLITVQGHVEDVGTKVHELEVEQSKQSEQLKQIDEVAVQVRANNEELKQVAESVEKASAIQNEFALQTEQQFTLVREDQEVTKQFAMKIEDRLNEEEKELFLDSNHILHDKMSLAMWMEMAEKDNRRKDEALRECTDKMLKQGRNVHDMMLETRRTLDDNTCAVEDVQRLLLNKADRTRVDEIIESKYEEICNQLDKALASVLGEEDEFKRVSQELQQLVTHLGESKADKKDLLEVKEQVLYDSRVRQQVENLRSFIDIKMNRDDVFSALKSKADKDEMLALLKSLSDGMNASIQQAQRSIKEPDSAFLTGKQAGHQHGGGSNSQKRTGVLPSLDREKCLSCNSQLRDASGASGGPITNKNPYQMAPVFGGGFRLGDGSSSLDKSTMRSGGRHRSNSLSNNNPTHASAPYLSPRTQAGLPSPDSNSRGQLSESASEGFLMGVDGHVYQADPDAIAQAQERTRSKLPQALAPRKALPVYEGTDGD
ncbi:hypothetical protein BBJ28_00002695 [Nothophytophthora sp. Chile5]|nr:hypothetical protein BBJ28_00002695 [Nothophytophthora sp. Chile5]